MLITVALVAHCFLQAASEDVSSIAFVCESYPSRVEGLFNALDLERKGLEPVKAAVAGKNWPQACQALLDYYRTGDTASWLRKPAVAPGDERVPAADEILNDEITLYTVKAKVPRRPDGGLDWTYNGPDNDREWGWALNRQLWARTLLAAYRKTGNRDYVRALDALQRDWVTSNPYPGEANRTPQWRGLEVYIRLTSSWAPQFYELQDVPEFSPAARILMLSSIPDHAHYARHFHAGGGNWIAMELLGLAMAAAYWPEFKEADSWYDYAMERMIPEMNRQVYPDGIQKELTSHYHRVTLSSFNRFAALADRVGQPIPDEFKAGIERMTNYLAYAMRPSGYGPLNNDSDLDYTRADVLALMDRFDRPDWRYIATNGKEGTKPGGPPSIVFPWAGQMVMRSGWDADAHWAFFDIGPLGIGHLHHDKLHLSVSAHGRDILVDGGRYSYVGGPWRNHFVGSESHNVILVDAKGQWEDAREASAALTDCYAITPDYDYARGTYDGGYADLEGTATHTRAMLYLRGQYWVVVDRITTDRPRTLEALWHFHPDCAVAANGASVASTDEGKGNVRITPISDLPWNVDLIKGQTEPHIQGWWSRKYNHKQPSTCAVYSTRIEETATFAWLVLPGKDGVPAPTAAECVEVTEKGALVRVKTAGDTQREVWIPCEGASARIDTPSE